MRKRFAVIGNPITHSLSPEVHQLFSQQTGCPLLYEKIQAPLGCFTDTVAKLVEDGWHGANVTLPFKDEALAIADTATTRARVAGAANTLTFGGEQPIVADSTDGAGLMLDLRRLRLELDDAHLLLIGAGGACRSILYPILESKVQKITLANRTVQRAHNIAQEFPQGKIQACGLDGLEGQKFDCVINTSSASLSNTVPSIPNTVTQGLVWGYDFCYGKKETAFVRWLKQHGVKRAYDGIGMLVGQAAESFFIWHGVRPHIEPVIHQLR